MTTNKVLQDYFEILQEAVLQNILVKINLGNYAGTIPKLKKCIIKPLELKSEMHLSLVYQYETRDITKNYPVREGIAIIKDWLIQKDFKACTIFTTTSNHILQYHSKKEWIYQSQKATNKVVVMDHDKTKQRKINDLSQSYLHALGITSTTGGVLKQSQDKYKQINQYIALLAPALATLPSDKVIRVADMGSGKGYLTFALYDYLQHALKINSQIVGVEYREDLVALCNDIAQQSSFEGLSFQKGSIADFTAAAGVDVLIALHACDTATDDAIYQGILHQAAIIVTAPCCHKQIRNAMEAQKVTNNVSFLTQYGIFLERQAEMITDGIRALLLQYSGYQVKVMQFISDAHTPKNVMILAEKRTVTEARKAAIREELKAIKSSFGIDYHHLERLLGLEER